MSAPTIEPTHETPSASEDTEVSVFDSLPAALRTALAEQGITDPTPVQSAVIPDAAAGHDVLGRAQTGSGKTLAFGLPVLARLAQGSTRPCHPRAVVIVPTRELATQVDRSLRPLANAIGLSTVTVYGGTPYDAQTRRLRRRADIVVATPGRLDDLFEQGYVFFDDVEVTVLDEADHLCDLGFYPAVDRLVGLTPAGSQRLLLSATLDGDVDALVRTHLRDPRRHEVDPNAGAVTTMSHHTLVVGGYREKLDAAADLVRANGRTIVFTRTRDAAVNLAAELGERGVTAVDLHGDLSQRVRERNLAKFTSGDASAVVATDVAARGIHVDHVDLVVHFDAANDPKTYLHRSGRTARAGRDGTVVTLTTVRHSGAVSRLHQGAGVEVLHHDVRSAPRPMTAEALVATGSSTPPRAPRSEGAPHRGQGPRRGGRPAERRSGGPGRGQQARGGKPGTSYGTSYGKGAGKAYGKGAGKPYGKQGGRKPSAGAGSRG
ncbi:DEAD/DEAH box helicase [Nocardioides sp.]|uniref:DEAD/DEAH box helicase n=1 Tax=Nocardioides sp. TaxID=35761 RepID=UPI003527A01D